MQPGLSALQERISLEIGDRATGTQEQGRGTTPGQRAPPAVAAWLPLWDGRMGTRAGARSEGSRTSYVLLWT